MMAPNWKFRLGRAVAAVSVQADPVDRLMPTRVSDILPAPWRDSSGRAH
jgi:hypothetical protein